MATAYLLGERYGEGLRFFRRGSLGRPSKRDATRFTFKRPLMSSYSSEVSGLPQLHDLYVSNRASVKLTSLPQLGHVKGSLFSLVVMMPAG
jgi:hypothetical protein